MTVLIPTMVFSQTQPANNSSSHYYSQAEFEDFIDNADVYTVMQRLFREGSVMKKAGFENMKMGELKRSSKMKKELFLKIVVLQLLLLALYLGECGESMFHEKKYRF